MSTSELYRDLDPKIAGPLAKVTEALKAEISSQIEGIRKDLQGLVSTDSSRSAPSSPAGELDPLEELKLAAAAIDRSPQQAAILTGLLEGAGRFSSRAAFVLIRDDGQTCWGSLGFEDAGRQMQGEPVATPNGDSPWARAGDGAGTLALTAEECAAFCSQFDAPTPIVGALLPLSLGEHVAGYLYADRVGDEHLNITALQLLTFVAGQTLETLPVRRRSSTPTLKVAAAVAAAAAVVPDVATLEPEMATPEPSFEPEAEVYAPEPEAAEPEFIAAEPEEIAPESAPAEPDPAPAEPDLIPPEPEMVAPDALLTEPELPTEPEPEPALDDEPTTAYGAVAELEPPAVDVEPAIEKPPAVEEQPEIAAETVSPEQETVGMPTPPAFLEEASTQTLASVSADEQSTEPDPAPEPPPAAPPADMASTQIVPPDDVRGPGWAFTTQEVATDAGSEALHEEARRLARLLVTEIKLYNEEQVEQGRRGGDIYRRLQDDIDRSRQIFEDRIDPQIRAENDYFKEALVRILAGGEESLLGM